MKIALVIANADYDGDGVIDASVASVARAGASGFAPDLANTTRDASDVAAALRAAGFSVRTVTNANRDQMAASLQRFGHDVGMAGPRSLAVLYYAGHAISDAAVDYLIPVGAVVPALPRRQNPIRVQDADPEMLNRLFGKKRDGAATDPAIRTSPPATTESPPANDGVERRVALSAAFFPLPDVVGALPSDGRAGSVLVILDSCRNNPFHDFDLTNELMSGRLIAGNAAAQAWLARGPASDVPVFAYASSPNAPASDEGYYARALARRLPMRGLSIQEMLARVRADVVRSTSGAQEPYSYPRPEETSVYGDCIVSCMAQRAPGKK